MIQELVRHPDERIKVTSADVRVFDQKLFDLIKDMKETMLAHDIKELSAIEVAVPACLVIIQEDDVFLELINPRIITMKDKVEFEESTGYFPGITAKLGRYHHINVIYEDRDGQQHSMKADGDLAFRIQKQVDYTFGGTFMDKLKKKDREAKLKEIEGSLGESIAESCPTVFYRDYFTKSINYLIYFALASLSIPFFTDSVAYLNEVYFYQRIGFTLIAVLLVGYVITALWESKKYTSCTSCQTGNIIGTVVIALVKTVTLGVIAHFWVNP